MWKHDWHREKLRNGYEVIDFRKLITTQDCEINGRKYDFTRVRELRGDQIVIEDRVKLNLQKSLESLECFEPETTPELTPEVMGVNTEEEETACPTEIACTMVFDRVSSEEG